VKKEKKKAVGLQRGGLLGRDVHRLESDSSLHGLDPNNVLYFAQRFTLLLPHRQNALAGWLT